MGKVPLKVLEIKYIKTYRTNILNTIVIYFIDKNIKMDQSNKEHSSSDVDSKQNYEKH